MVKAELKILFSSIFQVVEKKIIILSRGIYKFWSRTPCDFITMERKGTAKLRELLEIERNIQEKWEKEQVFSVDAPPPGSAESKWVLA